MRNKPFVYTRCGNKFEMKVFGPGEAEAQKLTPKLTLPRMG